MKKLLLVAFAFLLVGALAYTPALTQEVKEKQAAASKPAKPGNPVKLKIDPKDGRPLSPKSAASRLALCKTDCSPKNFNQSTNVGVHGISRAFNGYDPQLKSAEGQRSFAECVKKCADPLPDVYVQRAY